MSGETPQQKEARKMVRAQKGFRDQLKSGEYDVENRFDNYTNQFDYSDISKNLNDIFGETESKIERSYADTIEKEQGDIASQMASRGITGGSVLSDAQTKLASNVNKSKANALSDLGISEAQSNMNLQNYFNNLDFKQTAAAQDVDKFNTQNTLNSIMNSFGLQQNAAGGLSNTTWMDDVYAGLDLASKTMDTFGLGGQAGGGSGEDSGEDSGGDSGAAALLSMIFG